MRPMIIDFHAHIYPEKVAAKVLSAAEKKLKINVPCTGSPQDLRRRMHRSGIDLSIVLPLSKERKDVLPLNDWVLSVSGDGLMPFGAVHPLMDGLENELYRLSSLGCKGVKIMPLLQRFFPDDAGCEAFYEALIHRDLILVTHAGMDPLDRDEIFGTPERFAKVVESYPELRIVLAHLGGLRMWDDVRRHLLPIEGNVRFDTSYAYFYLEKGRMAELIKDLGTDRVLFGSDYPWEDPDRAVEAVKGLDLTEEEIQSLLWKNAAQLLKIEK
jgi:predicted TIM-barrel fold metal-dependent hydrolase